MRNPKEIRTKRFNSEKSAKNFAKNMNGNINDLRGNENSKSNFKVSYTKEDARDFHRSSSSDHNWDKDGYVN